ncbi:MULTISPECIES: hypothetical protein [Methylomonas]|uniref:Uncharacterized protein n=1 Tax=Methylomonas koyamae TaxID=702114 RepID=A0A177NPI6_9GAMM|nr:hypothetical protein [Methylomonas koyamae]OAI19977.1 hypothetical protein A1355_03250 [Methylomonas koyamae]
MRPSIYELAAYAIDHADRSHLEPPPVVPSPPQPKLSLARPSYYRYRVNMLDGLPEPVRQWQVGICDDVSRAAEIAYRKARGIYVPNMLELSNEKLASLSGKKCESASDTHTLPRKSGVNITFGTV